MRILVADDHDLVRQGIRRMVEQHRDLEVAAEASDGDQLLECLRTGRVDVVVMDISMPGPGFLKTLRTVKANWPTLPVLVVSMHPEEEWAVQALRAGASGYLSKRHSATELVAAIRQVHGGGLFVTQELAEGLAARLGLSPRTVSTYRARILEKLGLRTTADIIRYVAEHGLTL